MQSIIVYITTILQSNCIKAVFLAILFPPNRVWLWGRGIAIKCIIAVFLAILWASCEWTHSRIHRPRIGRLFARLSFSHHYYYCIMMMMMMMMLVGIEMAMMLEMQTLGIPPWSDTCCEIPQRWERRWTMTGRRTRMMITGSTDHQPSRSSSRVILCVITLQIWEVSNPQICPGFGPSMPRTDRIIALLLQLRDYRNIKRDISKLQMKKRVRLLLIKYLK